MLKKWCVIFYLILPIVSIAQKGDVNFENFADSLKQHNNFSEYIYIHLDKFSEKPSVEKLSIFRKTLSSLWRNPRTKSEYTALLYLQVNYGYYLKQYGFIDLSVNHYEKAYNIYKNNNIRNYNIIEFCLKPLANNYTRLGELDRAEDILKITIEKAQKENNKKQIIAGYSNLSTVFRTRGNYKEAISYLNFALKLADEEEIKSRIYSDLAINFLFLEKLQKVKKNIQLSNQLIVKNNSSISVKNSITLGGYYKKKREFKLSLVEFEKALIVAKRVFGKNDREVAKIYNQIAEVYQEQNQFKKALNSYQKSLQTLLPKYTPATIFENPLTTYFYTENTLKDALDGRASVFIEINNYRDALKSFDLAFKVEAQIRASYLNQSAKLIQQQENRNRSESSIDLCYELFKQTNNSNWIERAFQYAEQSKSIVLFEAKKATFLKSSLKKDSLFGKEEVLLYKKAQLNKSIIIEELKGNNAAVNLIAKLTKERNEISNELQLLKRQIQLKYPNLNIQSDSLISVKHTQEELLLNNKSLIEFFDGKYSVYIFYISKNSQIKLHKITKTAAFESEISEFLKLFSDDRGVVLQNNIREYTSLAYQLYKKLFNIELNEHTVIIPDGVFSFIPFDALVTEKTTNTNFKKLPYLLHKSVISYAYSATILTFKKKLVQPAKKEFIGYFPVFENNYRGLQTLNYTLQEAKSIEKVQQGKFLLGKNASKRMFNQQGNKYSIIHLSTHATAGDFYTPPAIEFYDETLYLPEIYGYNLQTDLLVLSACETGIGTIRKGEGVMSLARGFSYAGVRNVLVSLWKVNDKSTEKIMSAFYKNYQKTGNKAIALHNSKQQYLEDETISTTKKSPYYWA
ncbi:CHAT domain-containing protein, partial [Lutibacter sp.]